MNTSFKFPIAVLSLMFLFAYCHGTNSRLTPGQSIRDGETIISPSETFELGFFSPGDSPNRYLGIWYNKIIPVQTVVWVANRENPVTDSSGVLTLADDGNLVVLDGRGRSLWSSNSSSPRKNSTAYFLDTGNLVLSVGEVQDPNRTFWQSFDYPTDTYLPGMKAGLIPRSRKDLFTSWKSASDPARGNFSFGIDPQGLLQVVVWRGTEKHWRSGLWNGQIFIGVPSMNANYLYGFKISVVRGRSFLSYTVHNSSEILRFRLRWDGTEEQLLWDEGRKEWGANFAQPTRECEVYNTCGAYGSCSTSTSPICSCLQGFEPKSRSEWGSGNWSGGCMRRTELQCEKNISSLRVPEEDQFLQMDGVKLPDLPVSIASNNRSHCEALCLNNCSCKAYAYVTGIQCLTWSEEFIDIRQFQEGGETFYFRLAAAEIDARTRKRKATLVIVLLVAFGTIFTCAAGYTWWRCRGKTGSFCGEVEKETPVSNETQSRRFWKEFSGPDDVERNKEHDTELTMHTLEEILNATNSFSSFNKLGEGGFGPVYKGKLSCGLEVAIKRLSRKSGQGLEEFKNEIILIAKLQHRNLVRLVGYCVQGEEKMLVYEYLPNKGLDALLFAVNPQQELNWSRRFVIIEGIARGLLYLHRDSRLRIIHRDLKASNILLDEELNPKISDFGMAKIFGGNQDQANTNRVVGTYGYMAPEYAMEGLFSVKSDVYSFGVLLLEIISGKRNKYRHSETCTNLVGYAWTLWSEERAMEFIDPSVRDSCSQSIALRCLNVGLLCVQDSAMHRPIMSTVVVMLESDSAVLPTPREPTFTMGGKPMESELSVDKSQGLSRNSLTNTMVVGR